MDEHNRHGANATPKNESASARRFPLPEGEGDSRFSLRDFHGKPLSNLIGHIIRVCAYQMQAVFLTEAKETYSNIRLGSFVLIQQQDIRILASILNIESSESYDWVASLLPLGEISEQFGFKRGLNRYPGLHSEVHLLVEEDIKHIFKLKPQCFNLGHLHHHPGVEVYLDGSILCNRHFAILGQSGSGKSWTVASIIQRMITVMAKAHIVILDLHGEYAWQEPNGEHLSAFKSKDTHYLNAQKLEIPYWLMNFSELKDFLIDRNDPKASMQAVFLFDLIKALKQASALKLELKDVSIDAPVYFALSDVYKQIKEANEMRLDFGKTKGAWFGQFDALLIRLACRMNDVRYDFLLKPKKCDSNLALGQWFRDFIGFDKQITLIDLSVIPYDVRQIILALIGRLIFEFNYWNPKNKEFPVLLVCEEAHAYLSDESLFDAARKSMERIAKEGRKYGVGLCLVSQRPHELSQTILSQCGTYICLRMTHPDDQAYIKKLGSEGDLADILSSLARGEAIVIGEATPMPLRFQIFKPDPTPNSSDVNFHAAWQENLDHLDIEGIVDIWRRQGI